MLLLLVVLLPYVVDVDDVVALRFVCLLVLVLALMLVLVSAFFVCSGGCRKTLYTCMLKKKFGPLIWACLRP